MRRVVGVVLALNVAACSPAPPTPAPDPSQAIHVVNLSPRAVTLMVGSLLNEKRNTAARPCGGEVTLQVTPADFQTDGRLMAFLMVDPTGAFDVALDQFVGDPLDMTGTFTSSPIWSDGTLAGRLPVYLTVTPALTVTAGTSPPTPAPSACTPRF